MPAYHEFGTHIPLQDAGMVEFAADDPASFAALDACLGGFPSEGSARTRRIRYERYDQLLRLLSEIDRRLPDEHRRRLRCRIRCDMSAMRNGANGSLAGDDDRPEPAGPLEADRQAGVEFGRELTDAGDTGDKGDERGRGTMPDDDDEGWQPAVRLLGRIGPYRVSDCIMHRWFTLHFQPIVRARGGLYGYELLARPLPEQPPFRQNELVSVARDSGLHGFLERELLCKAIRLSNTHLSRGVKRFVHFLPSAMVNPAVDLERVFALIRDGEADPADYVFEIEKTERLENNPHLAEIAGQCRKRGAGLALYLPEEGGDPGKAAFLALLDLLRPACLKLGRGVIAGCHRDSGRQRRIREAQELAKRHQCLLLAEGVDEAADLAFLRERGVPLLQGYLTGPPTPVPVPPAAPEPASRASDPPAPPGSA